jgi:two-component system CitB family sensor kinase
MAHEIHRWSIATRLLVLQVVFVTALTLVVVALLWADSSAAVDRDAASKSMDIATSVADNPFVLEALATADPSLTLEPYVLKVMAGTSTDFITIMALDRTRYTHPNPEQIGRPFEGTIAPALHGVSFTETYRGTLGRSVRAVVPIRNTEGRIVALVSAGVEVSNVTLALWSRLPIVFAAAAATLLLGALASWSLSRYLRRVTWGRGPEEMSRMFSYHEGMLHSVREGLLLVDRQGRLVLYNDQAAELLGLPPQHPGSEPLPVAGLDIPEDLRELLAGGECAVDEIYVTDDRIIVVNQQAAETAGRGRASRTIGTVASLRDHTEVQRLSGELQTMRTLSDALRSQTHEFSNRMHTIVSLIELDHPQEAVRFATNEINVGQRLADQLVGSIDEPVLAALLLGKSAQADERGIELSLDVDPELGRVDHFANDLVTIIGNLLDNAMDAAAYAMNDGPRDAPPRVSVRVSRDAGGLEIRVADNGPGLADAELAFRRGFSTKEAGELGRGIGLALVRQTVRRLDGTIRVTMEGGAVFTVRLPNPATVGNGRGTRTS